MGGGDEETTPVELKPLNGPPPPTNKDDRKRLLLSPVISFSQNTPPALDEEAPENITGHKVRCLDTTTSLPPSNSLS